MRKRRLPGLRRVRVSRGFSAIATYIFASVCFVLSLKWMSAPTSARRGNFIGEIGMAAAILGALMQANIVSYEWIIVGLVLGAVIGAPLAIWMPMTAVPQRTAFSHACGALAAAVVGAAHYSLSLSHGGHLLDHTTMAILCVEVLLGSLTFTGSLMATGKLQEVLPQRPIVFKGQNILQFSGPRAPPLPAGWVWRSIRRSGTCFRC